MFALKDNTLQDVGDDEVDYDLISPNAFFSSHGNLIPMTSAVQGARTFYGSRFFNQALPVVNAEAPLVQNLVDGDPEGRTFDELFGRHAGALRADDDYEIEDVTPDDMTMVSAKGERKVKSLYNNFPFNRKSGITHTPVVQKGDKVPKGALLAKTNYTDDKGTLALGLNARVGLFPFKGHGMDDSVVVSQAFADRLTSDHSYTHQQDFDHDIKGGLHHYISLFPTNFTKEQLKPMDEHGVVRPGTVVNSGDPLILATRPKVISSTSAAVGNLSKAMRQSRADASLLWEEDAPGTVTDVIHNRGNVKVVVGAKIPTQPGDKVVARSGQKGVISLILPNDQMPRTADGKPLEVILNHLGIPSRANDALPFEVLLGKVARHTGQTEKMPSFTKPGEHWWDIVEKKLAAAGLNKTEEVWDPAENRKLENPITVGEAYILKLHHTSASKTSARSQGGYDSSQQPLKGGGKSAQAKRLSGLEIHSMLSASAYKNLREGATLRGARCFDASTEVLTKWGWVFWPFVSAKDLLLTQDGNGRSYFEAPSKLHRYEYHGDLFAFEGRYLDWRVTPDHSFWMRHIKSSKMQFKTAEELHGRTFYIPQFGAVWEGETCSCVEILTKPKWRTKAFSLPADDYGELLGWWLAEGYASVDKVGRGRTIISQNKIANPLKFQRIQALLDRLGFHYQPVKHDIEKVTFKTGRTGVEVTGFRIDSRPLAEHFLQFGKRSFNKRILDFVFDLPVSARLRLIDAYIEGDGHTQERLNCTSKRATSVSRQLIDDMQRLTILSGIGGCVAEVARKNDPAHYRKVWYLGLALNRKNATVDNWHSGDKFRHAFKERYDGFVYCATMPSGLLYVRRNGKPMWSGNCDEYWRALRQGYKPKEPGVPFVYDKFQALLQGSGLHARQIDKQRMRLGPFTDKDLSERKAVEIKHPELVNLATLEPVPGGLFDEAITGTNAWGKISLPHPYCNPAFEPAVRTLLGLTQKQLRDIIAGRAELPEELR